MAGIWLSENNQIGHLFSFAYEDDDNQGFDDYLNERLHFHATIYLDSALVSNQSVILISIHAGSQKTALTAKSIIFVNNGTLTFRYYDNKGNLELTSVTQDPVPFDSIVEIAVAVNGKATYSWDKINMYVNGVKQTLTTGYFPSGRVKPFQEASAGKL